MAKFKDKLLDWLDNLKNPYRLVLYEDTTLQEVRQFRVTGLNIFTYLATAIIVIFVISFLMFSYTPFKHLIPYDYNAELQMQINQNLYKLDSVEQMMLNRDKYLQNQLKIYMGEVPEPIDTAAPANINPEDISFSISAEDSMLRREIEREEKFNLAVIQNTTENENDINNLYFFAPVNKGMISDKFNRKEGHLAVDIVAQPDAAILAVLDGTVIESTWTLETGYVLHLQHHNNLVSIYKHNSSLLKKVGDKVRGGETIAIIGNTGELTTGPHLHFELWHEGTALDPEEYIKF